MSSIQCDKLNIHWDAYDQQNQTCFPNSSELLVGVGKLMTDPRLFSQILDNRQTSHVLGKNSPRLEGFLCTLSMEDIGASSIPNFNWFHCSTSICGENSLISSLSRICVGSSSDWFRWPALHIDPGWPYHMGVRRLFFSKDCSFPGLLILRIPCRIPHTETSPYSCQVEVER